MTNNYCPSDDKVSRCDIFASDPIEQFTGSDLAGLRRRFDAGLRVAQVFAVPVRRLDDPDLQPVRYEQQGISGRCRGVSVAQPIGAGAQSMMVKACLPGLDPGPSFFICHAARLASSRAA